MKKPKPYGFVPFNDRVEREQIVGREELRADRCHGKLSIVITALTPLLVATGRLERVGDKLVKGLTMRNGVPVIAGSTLKGMSRAHAEAMSYSCNLYGRVNYGKLAEVNKYPCNDQVKIPSNVRACVACRVYGYTMKQKQNVAKGLVDFTDFALEGEVGQFVTVSKIPSLYAPLRDAKALHYYQNDEDYLQKKMYRHGKPQTHTGAEYQVVEAGAVFSGDLTFQNLTRDELALLVLSLGAAQGERKFQCKLGYAKPAFFGSVQIEVKEVVPYARPFLSNVRSFSKEDLFSWAESYGQDEFLREQIRRVVDHYQYDRDKHNEWNRDRTGMKSY
ncbi:hypothetical protein CBW65_12610 [Tumebacillus avium]|uniref:CRISPR type III-associated protein domain-containing protein n=1 Tax=Tumebacillus avium TaxID=1903704 RepID=A0A1Y0IR12_9BACL|nr:RAMP superfamily CRISPR-associated protein [Tumebacillus avium]ARU61774.1 hypothetical protein CBW65_12610 [Tumebacillus avium]